MSSKEPAKSLTAFLLLGNCVLQTGPTFHPRLNDWLAPHSWFPLLTPWPLPLKTPQMFVIPWVLGPICLHAPLSLSLGVQITPCPTQPFSCLRPLPWRSSPLMDVSPSKELTSISCLLASQTLLLFDYLKPVGAPSKPGIQFSPSLVSETKNPFFQFHPPISIIHTSRMGSISFPVSTLPPSF